MADKTIRGYVSNVKKSRGAGKRFYEITIGHNDDSSVKVSGENVDLLSLQMTLVNEQELADLEDGQLVDVIIRPVAAERET